MTISKALSTALIDGTGAITPANVTVSTNNLTVGSALYVTNAGKIGIGVVTPAFKTEIVCGYNDGIHVKDSTANVYGGWFTESGTMALVTRSNHNLRIGTNDTTRIVIDNTGKVGLGNSPFQYNASTGVAVELSLQSNTTSNAALTVQSGLSRYWIGTSNTTNALQIGGNGSAMPTIGAINIDSAGKVGIGTISPSVKFHVVTGATGGMALFQGTSRTMYLEDDGATARISTEGTGPFAVRAASSGGSHFVIDTSGRVTLPYQPYGSVSWSGTLLRGNYIPFATANQERVAGLWNTSTYRFTAPVAGFYLFTCVGKTAGGGGLDFYISLVHNGNFIVDSWGYDASGKSYGVSLSHIRYLAANDYVQFYYNHDSGTAALATAWASYGLLG